MVDLMKSSYVSHLSPEGRVVNGYEALFYRIRSGDAEMDRLLCEQLPLAFRKHNAVLDDGLTATQYKPIFMTAFESSAQAVQDEVLSPQQIQFMMDKLESMTANQPLFYDRVIESVEQLNNQEIDFDSRQDRDIMRKHFVALQDNNVSEAQSLLEKIPKIYHTEQLWRHTTDEMALESLQARGVFSKDVSLVAFQEHRNELRGSATFTGPQITEDEVDKMAKSYERDKQQPIQYSKRAADVDKVQTQAVKHEPKLTRKQLDWQQMKQAEDVKSAHGQRHQMFETEILHRGVNHSQYTAGDDYGFDERDDEDELELG